MVTSTRETEFFPPEALRLGHGLFPAFKLELKHGPFLGLEPAGLRTGTYTAGPLAHQW